MTTHLATSICVFALLALSTTSLQAEGIIGTAASYDARLGFGVQVSPGGMRITTVDPGSPATRMGLGAGQLIFGIDGPGPSHIHDLVHRRPSPMWIRDIQVGQAFRRPFPPVRPVPPMQFGGPLMGGPYPPNAIPGAPPYGVHQYYPPTGHVYLPAAPVFRGPGQIGD